MDPITQQTVLGAAGSSAGGPLYVEDVFSCFLYEGNETARSINNGIDLSGKGGLTWIKSRKTNDTYPNQLYDTERGAGKYLVSNSNNTQSTDLTRLSAFNSDGFSLGTNINANETGSGFVSWSFRKAPGFFDICEWTGNSVSGRQIAHNLGSAPGFIMVKSYVAGTGGTGWMCYHRSLGNTKAIRMDNGSAATSASSAYWNNTDPTSTHFTVGNHEDINTTANSRNYVAYVFAHDESVFGTNEDESIIKCGSYTGNNSSQSIDVGFEPQWLMIKNISASSNWSIADVMRGLYSIGEDVDAVVLRPNSEYGEPSNSGRLRIKSTGFAFESESDVDFNKSGDTYIYIATRRPHKPPEAGTDVFLPAAVAGNSDITTGFPVDLAFQLRRTTGSKSLVTRLTGKKSLETRSGGAATTNANAWYESNTKLLDTGLFSADSAFHLFKRAPGFMDVVSYQATGSTRTVSHGLTVEPELIIIKCRTFGFAWTVYSQSTGNTKYLSLNSTAAETTATYWNSTNPTSTGFTVVGGAGVVNATNTSAFYNAYLFATLAGISKVGSYTGTGNAIDVDCGFSSGARYLLIKRTDSTGDWYVWDTARGIVSGNDPYLLLNDSAGDVTNTDYIDPLNSGFTVTSSAPTGLNASGGTYLFLAIA